MNHSLIHKLLGLALFAGVFLAFITGSSQATEGSPSDGATEIRSHSFTLTKEPVSTP